MPTYKEMKNLPILLERIERALAPSGCCYEVIIVNDEPKESKDIQRLADSYNLRIVNRPRKMGAASAVADGIKVARYGTICTLSADLQHPPEIIPRLIDQLKEANIVIASRYIDDAKIKGWNILRRVISKTATKLARTVLTKVRDIKDPLSGFYAFKKDVVKDIKLNPIGFKLLLEILIKGKYSSVVELPYTFEGRKIGKSKLSLAGVYTYLKQLLSLMEQSGEFKRIAKFCSVGLTGIFVNEGTLWLLTEKIRLFYMLSAPFAVESAIVNNFTWNEVWTFRDLRKKGIINIVKRMLKFNLTRLIGLVMNLTILFILTELVGIYYLISNLVSIIVVAVWDYTASMGLVWSC